MKRMLLTGLFASALAWAPQAGATALEDLFAAVQIDNLRDVRRLIQDGVVDPNVLDAHGDPLLMVAIRNDATRVSDYLITSRKVSLDAPNGAQETPLMLAAYRNKPEIVSKLLDGGAQVNKPGWSALHYASSAGAADVVKMLLAKGAAVNALSPNRTTPLMMAARGDHADVCRLLVSAGADPTLVNDSDLGAADYAMRANDAELGRFLVAQRDEWNARFGGARTR